MKVYYFEESGYYKIRKDIIAENKEKAIQKYEEWLDDEFYKRHIDLESEDIEITSLND